MQQCWGRPGAALAGAHAARAEPVLSGDRDNGAAIFRVQCAACHGADARGGGELASKLPVAVGNLRDPALLATRSNDDLKNVILKGIPAATPPMLMPGSPWLNGSSRGSHHVPAPRRPQRHRLLPHRAVFHRQDLHPGRQGPGAHPEAGSGHPVRPGGSDDDSVVTFYGEGNPKGPEFVPQDPVQLDKLSPKERKGYLVFVDLPQGKSRATTGIALGRDGQVHARFTPRPGCAPRRSTSPTRPLSARGARAPWRCSSPRARARPPQPRSARSTPRMPARSRASRSPTARRRTATGRTRASEDRDGVEIASALAPAPASFRHRARRAGLGGTIKVLPEDFVVEELGEVVPSGAGEHLYLWIEKRGRDTPEVAAELARAYGIAARDVGYAGLKDRQALTRQWFSAPAKALAAAASSCRARASCRAPATATSSALACCAAIASPFGCAGRGTARRLSSPCWTARPDRRAQLVRAAALRPPRRQRPARGRADWHRHAPLRCARRARSLPAQARALGAPVRALQPPARGQSARGPPRRARGGRRGRWFPRTIARCVARDETLRPARRVLRGRRHRPDVRA